MTLDDKNLPDGSSRKLKLYGLVAVSFGLLFILQAAVNISLRLALCSSDARTLNSEAVIKTEEGDELKRRLTTFDRYSVQGWVYFNHSFYYISDIKISWQKSRDYCLQRGADLVIINSKEEQKFARQFKRPAWIGLTDRETEGTWKWVDGTLLTTSYWNHGEPNSFKSTNEDCGEIRFFGQENNWNDSPCRQPNYWICEKMVAL